MRRVMSLPREQEEWQERLAIVQKEVAPLEAELDRRRAELAFESEALRLLEKSFAESDQALGAEIAARKREKLKLEKQIEGLERAKTKPYREIGKVLADQGIEPMNQPEALADVLGQREKIAATRSRMALSVEKSRQEKRIEVWGSWALLFTFAVLTGGVVWFATKG